jgi:hypothetical protein
VHSKHIGGPIKEEEEEDNAGIKIVMNIYESKSLLERCRE